MLENSKVFLLAYRVDLVLFSHQSFIDLMLAGRFVVCCEDRSWFPWSLSSESPVTTQA